MRISAVKDRIASMWRDAMVQGGDRTHWRHERSPALKFVSSGRGFSSRKEDWRSGTPLNGWHRSFVILVFSSSRKRKECAETLVSSGGSLALLAFFVRRSVLAGFFVFWLGTGAPELLYNVTGWSWGGRSGSEHHAHG